MKDRSEKADPPLRTAQSLPPESQPVATGSILACDLETGQLGVSVQSHYFVAGGVSPHAQAGVGAVMSGVRVAPYTIHAGVGRDGRFDAQRIVRVAARSAIFESNGQHVRVITRIHG